MARPVKQLRIDPNQRFTNQFYQPLKTIILLLYITISIFPVKSPKFSLIHSNQPVIVQSIHYQLFLIKRETLDKGGVTAQFIWLTVCRAFSLYQLLGFLPFISPHPVCAVIGLIGLFSFLPERFSLSLLHFGFYPFTHNNYFQNTQLFATLYLACYLAEIHSRTWFSQSLSR